MDSGNILTIIIAILAAIGLPLAFKSRKKGGQDKVGELCQHLQGMGVKASILGSDTVQGKMGGKSSWGQKSVGVIELAGKNIDSINVIGAASQHGAHYFLDFLVSSSNLTGRENRKKTRMVRKRSSALWGKVIDIEWRGDDSLARRLNFDYGLKDRLLQADLSVIKGSICIFHEPKYGYSRVRTNYFLPTPDLFEVIDTIAKHIKSEY